MAFSSDPFGPNTPSSTYSLYKNFTVSDPILPSGTSPLIGNPLFESAANLAPTSKWGHSTGDERNERLFVTRPRYASSEKTDRGTHAFIKLMTSSEQASSYAGGTSSRINKEGKAESSVLAESLSVLTSNSSSSGYDKFLVTAISAGMEEKVQIMEVFGDNEVTYFFGRSPMMFTISGVLVDSADNSWFTDWLTTYEGAFRGSRLARNHEMLKLVLPSMTLVGAMVNFSWEQQSLSDVNVPFRFQFLVRSITPTPITSSGAITNAAQQINFDSLMSFQTQTQINSLRTQSATLISTIQDPNSTVGQIGSALSRLGSGVSAGLGLPATPSSVSGFIDSLSNMTTGANNSLSDVFSPIISSLNGIRATLFSPIYGVMNSLTRLVRNVFGSTGVGSILSALTAPIRNMLGDITRISAQASAIVGMVTSGLSNLGRGVATGFGITQSYKTAIRQFEKTAGTIAAAPLSISSNIKNLVNGGYISTSAVFLQSNPKYGLSSSASLSSSEASLSPQLAILSGGTGFTPASGASL